MYEIITGRKRLPKNLNVSLLPELEGGNIINQKAELIIQGKEKTQVFYDRTGRKYPVKTYLLLSEKERQNKNIQARCILSNSKTIEIEGVLPKTVTSKMCKRNNNIKIKK